MPIVLPSMSLDYGLKLGAFLCAEDRVGMREVEGVFGVVLMNAWSVRDVEYRDYVPLEPSILKNLGTSVSPWVVTTEALEPILVERLWHEAISSRYTELSGLQGVYDLELEIDITCKCYLIYKLKLFGNYPHSCDLRQYDDSNSQQWPPPPLVIPKLASPEVHHQPSNANRRPHW